jgi:hypothetical protein
MKTSTSLRLTRCPENTSGPGNLKPWPQRWRIACASLALAGLALCATSARAQNWIDTDLGGPAAAGYTVTNLDGTMDIFGGGSDIWGNTSQCHYRYAWASGTTWDMTIQVTNLIGVDATWTKVELMVDWADPAAGPQGSDPFIANMNTLPTGDNEFGVDQFRATSGGSADWKQVGTSPHPVYPNVWMRIHRNGSIFSIFYSTNNVNWTDYLDIDTSQTTTTGVGGVTFPGTAWPNLVCVGIAVTAHNNGGSLADATVANVSSTFGTITPPTVVNVTAQVTNCSTYVGSEASFTFQTTNNANPNVVLPNYQWYKNGVAVTNVTGNSFTWLAAASDNGAQVYCKATVPPPYNTTVTSVTSSTGTLAVASGTIVTNGLKREFFANTTSRTAVEAGNVGRATSINVRPNFGDLGGYGANYIQRLSGYFIPPTSDNYVFFVASDDDSDIFLSTNSIATNKVMICQEVGYSGFNNWFTIGGNGSTAAQKRSDQFVDPVTSATPGLNGIPLLAGHLYYIEGVMHQGGGGDDFSVTYQTVSQVNASGWGPGGGIFDDGTNSILMTASNNIAFISYPDTTPTWTLQPTNTTVTAGTGGGFAAKALSGGEFDPTYQWYSNNVAVAGATSSILYYPSMPTSANGAQYYCVATGIMNGLSSTSSIVTLQVASGVLENGWVKVEWWYGGSLAGLEAGTLGTSTNIITSPRLEADTTGSSGNNYANRLSTLFYPPTNGNYVFFVSSDDASDLFVSTDSTPGNKRKVAQETAWSNARQWTTSGDNVAAHAAQKRSDQWETNGAGVAPYAAGIPMTNGQAYYIELDHQDTGGGENAGATFIMVGDADPALGSASKFFGTNIAMNVPRSFYVGFTQQPANVSVPVYSNVVFTVAGATDSQVAVGGTGNDRPLWNNRVAYQWLKNGVPIPGATSQSYGFGPVSPLDSGTQFSCQIRSLGYVNNFGVDISSNSTTATVTVTGTPVFETGYALHQYWSSNPGRTAIEAFTAGAPAWQMSTPAFEADITGTEVADNFCDDLIGYFIPATPGNYVFFCNSDDDADVFLSTNSSFSNARLIAQQTSYGGGALNWPSTANGTASQVRSDTFIDPTTGLALYASGIPLVAGQKYAMQIVHHQGGGGTYSCVTAMLTTDPNYPTAPASGTLSIIRGSQLGTYVPACTYVNITNQPQSLTVNNYGSASFGITAGTDSKLPIGPEGDWRNYFNNFLTYQWYKNNVAIAGATSPTYSIPVVLPTDNGAQIYCTTRALGYADISGNVLWATSHVASLTVNISAPQMTYSSYYANSNYVNFGYDPTNYIIIAFSAPMDPNLLSQPSTYILPPGLTLLSILVNTNDYRSVALAVSGTITLPLNVQVSSSLAGMGGGLAVSNTSVAINTVPLTDADIGSPGSDPAVPGMMFVEGANAYTIACEGSDIYNNADGFNFAYEMKTNDFDVVVRQRDNKHTSNWAKGGLMVRETLDANSRDWNIINDPVASDGINAPDNSGFGANAVECNARNSTGGGSGGWNFQSSPVPAYPNAWVRLKRTGNLLSAYYSTNGTSWTLQATNDPTFVGSLTALSNVVYVGICTTAHNNDPVGTDPTLLRFLNTVDYDNYNSSYVAATILTAKVTGSNITITWTPSTGHLLSSPALSGPNMNWQSVTGGTGGSVTIPITGSSMFFKVATP